MFMFAALAMISIVAPTMSYVATAVLPAVFSRSVSVVASPTGVMPEGWTMLVDEDRKQFLLDLPYAPSSAVKMDSLTTSRAKNLIKILDGYFGKGAMQLTGKNSVVEQQDEVIMRTFHDKM